MPQNNKEGRPSLRGAVAGLVVSTPMVWFAAWFAGRNNVREFLAVTALLLSYIAFEVGVDSRTKASTSSISRRYF